jgi:serine/threonine protein kinase
MNVAMDEVRWQRVKSLFAEALERDAAERDAFLKDACGTDAELRAEIDSLISAHDTTDDFIARPAAQRAFGFAAAEFEPKSWIGRRVGDYRLVEEVGRGGMSEVFKGVRDDDEYHKEVAVKVLRQGYDTKSLLKRFKVETQILATLDHPNIARLLDAGTTPEGLPFLVMDYIPGQPIDDYCAARKLSLKGRLDLFRALCGAVQYVHQHLMVHGDLKCTNVLVSERGTVKLLDFGIARLLAPTPGANLPEGKPTTHIALTPEYASPEQIRGGPVTTVSDVYSLGVVLYQLVTGVLPYRLRGDFSYELATRILDQEARPPSVACEIDGFARQLRGDLDNIILMALEKNPARRYPSVEAFEADLRRYLEGFPVSARAAGVPYRFFKFASRHKAGFAAISLLLATLIGGIVSTTWQARVADAERVRAERHFNEVRKLANVFMFDLHKAIEDLPGSTPARQMLVQNSLKYLEALSAESASEPSLQRELASAYEKVADVQGGYLTANLGDTPGALSSYRKSLLIRRTLSDADPNNRELRRELLRSYGKLSELLAYDDDQKGALLATRQALKLAQELAAAPDATAADRRNLGSALVSLGWQLTAADQFGDGMIFMRQAVAIYESLLEAHPDDFEISRILSITHQRIGEALLANTTEHAEALESYTKSLDLERRMAATDAHNTRVNKLIGVSLLGMASALVQLKRPQEALQRQLEAARILRAILDLDPQNEVARFDTAFALNEASASAIALGDVNAAEQRLTQVLAILSASNELTQPKLTNAKVLLAIAYYNLGQSHARRAAAATATRAERMDQCQEAQRWFDLSRPSLTEADANPPWANYARGRMARIVGELSACTTGLTALK